MTEEQEINNIPPPGDGGTQDDQCRLWIGNLDPRITEFALLKILQKHGQLAKFDFLYHKSGPDQGKPRGYCFVTYESKEEADKAMKKLNGKLALSQRLIVKRAHADKQITSDETKAKLSLLSRSTLLNDKKEDKISVDSKIRAIEAKLKLMEEGKEAASSNPSYRATSSTNKLSASLNSNARRKPYIHQSHHRR